MLEDRSMSAALEHSEVVSWGSEISNAFCDGGGKHKMRNPDQRDMTMKEITKLSLYILDGI